MSTHTPGPWRIDPRASARVVAGEDDTVANVACQSNLRDQHPYNARLIASAPEMYEALKRILHSRHIVCTDPDDHECPLHAGRAAIAKAEGK